MGGRSAQNPIARASPVVPVLAPLRGALIRTSGVPSESGDSYQEKGADKADSADKRGVSVRCVSNVRWFPVYRFESPERPRLSLTS